MPRQNSIFSSIKVESPGQKSPGTYTPVSGSIFHSRGIAGRMDLSYRRVLLSWQDRSPQTEAKESRGSGGWGTNDDSVFAQEFPKRPTIFVGRFSSFRDVSVVSSQRLAEVAPLELLDGHRL